MLLEDSARGGRVECLLCKRRIEVDASGSGSASGERPKVPPLPKMPGPTAPTAERQKILNCPKSNSPLRVPPGHEGKPLRCPRCRKVFKP